MQGADMGRPVQVAALALTQDTGVPKMETILIFSSFA